MTLSAPPQLRLYVEQSPKPVRPPVESIGNLPGILEAFQATTGWSLRYVAGAAPELSDEQKASVPVGAGAGSASGHLRLEALAPQSSAKKASSSPVEFETARRLAESLGGLINELQRTRDALCQREAELAAGIPFSLPTGDEAELAERLRAALRGGAEAASCHAAALYLLDEGTTELKLRSSWGLPFERLAAPARQLKGCLADLEALLGHAVVLENTALMPGWNAPEDFPAAVCVPVSSPTTLLGTLWVFCVEPRDFTDQQVNMLEITAGKIAGDLEREMLLREGCDGARLKKQWAAAERLQRHQLPSVAPLLDGWELAGGATQAQGIGGAFYDWFCLPDDLLAFAVGESTSGELEAALAAGAVRTAVRAHGQYHRQAQSALQQANLTLWTGSAGDQFAAIAYGLVETATGKIRWAGAGQPSVVLLRNEQWKSLTQTTPLLGESPETEYTEHAYTLRPGEALAVFTAGFRSAVDAQGRCLGEEGLAQLLSQNLHLSAAELSAMMRQSLRLYPAGPRPNDLAWLIIKRSR